LLFVNNKMTSFPVMSRRTFRGRAGPTDGRLNKHQARKRKQPKLKTAEKDTEHGEVDKITSPNEVEAVLIIDAENSLIQKSNEYPENGTEPFHEAEKEARCQFPTEASPADKEIKHLLLRIKNLSESISLSSAAISNPETWRNNVLNAVRNCIIEWRAILDHYELNEIQIKDPSLATFLLIQQTMQCGPLTGSNPGYFKRCGSSVAKQALVFLNETVPTVAGANLYFTEKQSVTIEKWKTAAARAAEKDKLPSKSQFKKQTGKSKHGKKK